MRRRELKTGLFIFNGGRLSEKRDKPCSECGKLIMRKSTYCRGCSQKGDRSTHYIANINICTLCNGKKSHIAKMCQKCLIGKNHPNYKEMVGYVGLHYRIRNILGKATECKSTNCKQNSNVYQWANISGEYKYTLDDWIQLCRSCHAILDRSRKSKYKEMYVY